MNAIRRIWQMFSPDILLVFVRLLLEPESYRIRRRAVLSYYKNRDPLTLPPAICEGLKYLKWHKYASLPYNWTQKYDRMLPEVIYDEANKSFYTVFEGKRMYFPKRFTETEVIYAVRSILKEQDPQSPHLYLPDEFQIETDSIVIDSGVAEGNFALKAIDKAKRLYLVECDKEWIEALMLTFSPWKEKVVFVEKYMSDNESDTTVSIDSLVFPETGENYFIKMDIEGFEKKALAGMKRLVESGCHIKIDVCTYHHPDDFNEIKKIMKSYGFFYQIPEGYILYFQPGEEPSFRKALIRGMINV
jgi:hypothetical protein